MSNPITSWIIDGMEGYGQREAEMTERLSETSINAQKIVDERSGPYRGNNWWRNERRSRDFDHFYTAGSAFKGKEEGCISSFKAARHYGNESAKKRDELLAEIAAEETK